MNATSFLEITSQYITAQNWSVFPVGRNKKPLIEWKEYQTRKPTLEELKQWNRQFPNANIGLVTGEISGVIVVDIDPRHNADDKDFKDIVTVKSKTGGGGEHYFFKYEAGFICENGIQPGIDIKTNGGFAIIPPSIHSSGNKYEWINSPDTTPLAPLPAFVKDWYKSINKTKSSSKWNEDILDGVSEGQRNESATSVAGKLLKHLPEDDWETTGWKMLQAWNTTCKPPLPINELRTTFESIKTREQESREENKEKRVALRLVEEVGKSPIVLFHNEKKEAYVALSGDGREILKITSKLFKSWLYKCAWEKQGALPSGDVINNVIQSLIGKALFDGEEHPLHVRIALHNNAIWYDLGDGSVVRIVKEGWAVIEKPPILFSRFAHQKVQVQPKRGGNLNALCEFINLASDEEKLLFLVYAVSAFIPEFPHPLLILYGPQGAGKTTPLKLLRMLVDPSELKTLSAPDNLREFVQTASHHYLFFLDNLSALPGWLSDALARACTGDGFSKRELYSDDDDVIYSFQRAICLNGINLVVQKADLLDRSIILGLERISKDKRREEQEFWKEFENQRPYLLGAIFDTVAKAIEIHPAISLSSYPRMADFTRWGCAITQALGYTQQEFLTAYYHNIDKQNEEAIEASPVGVAVLSFMEDQDNWEGTASDLLSELEKLTIKLKIDTRSRDWPKSAASVSRRIQLIQANLSEKGIIVVRDDKARPRRLTISKHGENIDGSDISSENGKSEPNLVPTTSKENQENSDISIDGQIRAYPTLPTTPTAFPTVESLTDEEIKQIFANEPEELSPAKGGGI